MMQLVGMVTLAGAPKDEQPGGQPDAGFAKKRSHKPGTVSAESCGVQEQRQKSEVRSRRSEVRSRCHPERSRGTPWNVVRHMTGFLDCARNEIERLARRITVSRSGSNFQKYRVE